MSDRRNEICYNLIQKYTSFHGIHPVHMLLESFQRFCHFRNQISQTLNLASNFRFIMKNTTAFIIEKETPVANMIRYHLLARQVKQVQIFPSVSECLYYLRKRSVPDFLIADLGHPEIDAESFLNTVLQSCPGIRVLFLSPFTDDTLVAHLMEKGATDYIQKSGKMEVWIPELIKNMEFLLREKSRTR
jgi:FixJ family two-component response regulator